MKTVRLIFWGHVLAAAAGLSLGYLRVGLGAVSLAIVGLCAVWVLTQSRGFHIMSSLVLLALLAGGGLGMLLEVPGPLALVSVVAGLGAWDLDHFLRRLASVEHVEFSTGIARMHLRRLGLVEAGGLVIGLVGLAVRLQLGFWWEALLVVLVVVGLSRLIDFVRKKAEDF